MDFRPRLGFVLSGVGPKLGKFGFSIHDAVIAIYDPANSAPKSLYVAMGLAGDVSALGRVWPERPILLERGNFPMNLDGLDVELKIVGAVSLFSTNDVSFALAKEGTELYSHTVRLGSVTGFSVGTLSIRGTLKKVPLTSFYNQAAWEKAMNTEREGFDSQYAIQ